GRSAAWMMLTPSSTSMVRPSISILGMSEGMSLQRRHIGPQRAAAEGGVLFELGAELGSERPRGHGSSVRQRTDGVALDVVGDVQEQIDVGRRGGPILEPRQHAMEPAGALAARRALAARLVVEEAAQVQE